MGLAVLKWCQKATTRPFGVYTLHQSPSTLYSTLNVGVMASSLERIASCSPAVERGLSLERRDLLGLGEGVHIQHDAWRCLPCRGLA